MTFRHLASAPENDDEAILAVLNGMYPSWEFSRKDAVFVATCGAAAIEAASARGLVLILGGHDS